MRAISKVLLLMLLIASPLLSWDEEYHGRLAGSCYFTSSAGTRALDSVYVDALPTGASISRAYLTLTIGTMCVYSHADAYLNGVQTVQVKKSPSGSWTTGISFKASNKTLYVDSLFTRGYMVIGNVDVSGEVDAGGEWYLFQFVDMEINSADAYCKSVQTTIRLEFTYE